MLSGSVLSSGAANDAASGRRLLRVLGSRYWMAAFFAFALVASQVAIHRPAWLTAAWALPLLLFSISLVSAIATNPRFRADAPLLTLHFGLLALVLLVAISRLSYLDGAVTLTQDVAFEGELLHERKGPFHGDAIRTLRFMHLGTDEVFEAGASRPAVYSRVRWWDAAGRSQEVTISDNHPLVVGGYRIFATFNRGYSPVFSWRTAEGRTEVGTIQLGAGESFSATNTWRLVDGTQVWLMLDAPELRPLQRGERRTNFAADRIDHSLVVRSGESRTHLRVGESIRVGGGELRYLGLKIWMGYRIVHDVATYWLLAAVAVTIGGMIWFYAGRVFLREGELP